MFLESLKESALRILIIVFSPDQLGGGGTEKVESNLMSEGFFRNSFSWYWALAWTKAITLSSDCTFNRILAVGNAPSSSRTKLTTF